MIPDIRNLLVGKVDGRVQIESLRYFFAGVEDGKVGCDVKFDWAKSFKRIVMLFTLFSVDGTLRTEVERPESSCFLEFGKACYPVLEGVIPIV